MLPMDNIGKVCMHWIGGHGRMVGNAWELDHFGPAGSIPSKVNLTRYPGGSQDFIDTPLDSTPFRQIGDFSIGHQHSCAPAAAPVKKFGDMAGKFVYALRCTKTKRKEL